MTLNGTPVAFYRPTNTLQSGVQYESVSGCVSPMEETNAALWANISLLAWQRDEITYDEKCSIVARYYTSLGESAIRNDVEIAKRDAEIAANKVKAKKK